MRQFVEIGVFLPERLGFVFVGAAEMARPTASTRVRRVPFGRVPFPRWLPHWLT
jgi:hypothetical protein